ncbi:MAG: SLBB domain-containing protein [Chitinophagales bacterium]|nr:SLBB domain-containing protein [Chitinophagales bacterium]
MKLFQRLVLLVVVSVQISFGQTTEETPPNNAPSSNGYMQQAITENVATMQLLGINPIQVKGQKGNTTVPVTVQPGTTLPLPTGTTTVTPPPAPQSPPPVVTPPDTTTPYVDTTLLPASESFGYSYFRNRSVDMFNSSVDGQASGTYVIGVGDQIGINVWGYSSFSGSYTVDQTGSIFPEGVGKVYVKGLTLDKAKALIKSRFGTYLDMPNSQIEVTIIYSRVIGVNIVGEVFNPGTYSIPALNTAFNALFASGGPTDLGSLRKIYIKRQGQTVTTLDIYAYLLNPTIQDDYFLQSNDYIFVPPVGKVVSITGEVKRPFRYELIEGENLNTLINYAGGLTPQAYTKSVQVKRYVSNRLELYDVNLDSLTNSNLKYELMNGDEVFISTVPSELFQFVKVSGAVMQPGEFNFTSGLRISDILATSHGLREDALADRAYVIRRNEDLTSSYIPFNPTNILNDPTSVDNMLLSNLDEIYFYDKTTFMDSVSVSINGAVRLPGQYTYGRGMTLNDLLFTAGGIKAEAANTKIEVSRYRSENGKSTPQPKIVASFPIDSNLIIGGDAESFKLEPFDLVFVRSLINRESQGMVTVNGEVIYPGEYSLNDKEEKIVEVLNRAGGLSQWANVNQATLVREENDRGIIFMDLEKAFKNPESEFNFILRAGDIISIPTTNDIVSVSGMINFPYVDTMGYLNAPYHEGKRAKFYVKKYGLGFAKDAKRTRTYVIQPGGKLEDPRRWAFIRIYPKVEKGAYVVVPYRTDLDLLVAAVPAQPVDVNAIIESALVKVTGLLTLYILVTRINF